MSKTKQSRPAAINLGELQVLRTNGARALRGAETVLERAQEARDRAKAEFEAADAALVAAVRALRG